jgi:cell wall assembly regulator SMI1
MGLLAFVIRLTLWRALYDATYAGTNVFDSVAGALEMKDDEDADSHRPVLTVVTDEENLSDVNGHNWLTATREIEVVVEMAIWTALKDKSGWAIPHTNEGCEQALNYLGRQVMRIMQVDDITTPWSDLYRTFAGPIIKVEAKRAASEAKGERFAARQIVITVRPSIGEPAFGVAPQGEWARLIAAMEADEMLADMAPGLAAEITGAAIPEWARLQASIGHTRGTMAALGIGPLPPADANDPPEEPAVLTVATTQGDHIASEIVRLVPGGLSTGSPELGTP